MKRNQRTFLLYSLAVILLLSLPACQTQNISNYYHGAKTNPADSLPLAGKGQQSSQWKTFDLQLDYRYQSTGGALNISGNASLSDYYQINMTSLRKLDLYLFFLDDESRILETVQLLKSMSNSLDSTLSFNKNLTIPQSATAISLGYDGVARGDQELKRFHSLPQQVR